MMGWGYGHGMGLWGWLMMGGFWLLLLTAAIVTVAWIFPRDRSRAAGPEQASRPATPPLSILDDRLARGDIDVDTYRALRAELAAPTGRYDTMGS